MYNYETEKPFLFTDEGQRVFLKVRDRANHLFSQAGAFRVIEVLKNIPGASWSLLAAVDRLVELGEFVYVDDGEGVTQLRILTKEYYDGR